MEVTTYLRANPIEQRLAFCEFMGLQVEAMGVARQIAASRDLTEPKTSRF